MTRELLNKCNELQNDIDTIKKIIDSSNKGHWINIITADYKDLKISSQLQDDLTEWLKTKRSEYIEKLRVI